MPPRFPVKLVERHETLIDTNMALGYLLGNRARRLITTPTVAEELARLTGIKRDYIASAIHIEAPEFPLEFDEKYRVSGFKYGLFTKLPEYQMVREKCRLEWSSLAPADRELAVASLWLKRKGRDVVVLTDDDRLIDCLEKIGVHAVKQSRRALAPL